jgi:hypothetical protein
MSSGLQNLRSKTTEEGSRIVVKFLHTAMRSSVTRANGMIPKRNGVAWYFVAWRGVSWRGVAWRGVTWRDVTWRGVAWSGVAALLLNN